MLLDVGVVRMFLGSCLFSPNHQEGAIFDVKSIGPKHELRCHVLPQIVLKTQQQGYIKSSLVYIPTTTRCVSENITLT